MTQAMTKDHVDGWRAHFPCCSPVIGCEHILFIFERVVIVLVIVGNLCSSPRREANFAVVGSDLSGGLQMATPRRFLVAIGSRARCTIVSNAGVGVGR